MVESANPRKGTEMRHERRTSGIPGEKCMICEDVYPRVEFWSPPVDDVIKLLEYRHTVDKTDVHLYQTSDNKMVCIHCGKSGNYPLHHDLEMLATLLGKQAKSIEQLYRELHPTLSPEAVPEAVSYIKNKRGIYNKVVPKNGESFGVFIGLVAFLGFAVGSGVSLIIGGAVWGW